MTNKENCDYPATRIAQDPPDLIPMVSAKPNSETCKKCDLEATQRCRFGKVRCLPSQRPNREIIYFVHRKQKKGNEKQ